MMLLLPPLDPKCTLMVKKLPDTLPFFPITSHCATRGLRLADHAEFVGSIRPGLKLREGPSRTAVASREPPGLALNRRTSDGL